jgi:flagellar protein FlbD
MISVHRLNGKEYYLNAELIMSLEATPDTMVTLVSGDKFIISEGIADVCAKIIEYKRLLYGAFNEISGRMP